LGRPVHAALWPYSFSPLIKGPMFWGMEGWDGWEAEIQERLAELTVSIHRRSTRELRSVLLEGVELNQVCGSASAWPAWRA
jgi:hypothetical protein